MINFSHFIIRQSRYFGGRKTTNMDKFFVYPDDSPPFSDLLMPANSFEPTGIPTPYPHIARVLSSSAFSEILATVIKCIPIFVVSAFRSSTPDNKLVHPNVPHSYRVKTIGMGIPLRTPIPLIQPFKVNGIHDGILPLRERDESVKFVERLNNCVSFHAAFHRASFKGPLRFSRILS